MKLPIPDDWNGQDWQCIEVQWPKSQKYNAVLLGLLSYLTRGRLWDESTGTIRDAQAIGWEVFYRNYPLTECTVCDSSDGDNNGAGDAPSYTSGQIIARGTGAQLEEEEDMGQVVTDVQIVNGQIRVFFGPCCWKDLGELSDFVSDTDELEDTPLNPNDETPDPNTYSACAKAWAIVDAIELILNAAHDQVLADLAVWLWPGKVETAVDMNLNDKWTVALIIDWAGLGVLITPENAFTDEDQQKSVAALMNVFENDAVGVPDEATYEAVKNAIHTRGLVYDGMIMTAIAALGRKNLDSIAKLAAGTVETRSCGEPDTIPIGETEPDAQGWYLSENLADHFVLRHDDGPGAGWAVVATDTFALPEDTYGTFTKLTVHVSKGTLKRMSANQAYGTWPGAGSTHTAYANGSDNLQSTNLAFPIISTLSAGIRTNLAAQRGFLSNTDGGSGGVNGINIGTPPAVAGATFAAAIHADGDYVDLEDYTIDEFRLVYNVNSPSHA